MPQEILSSVFPANLDSPFQHNCPQTRDNDLEALDENDTIVGRFQAFMKVVHARQLHFTGPDRQTGELLEVTVPAASMSRYTRAGRSKIKRKLFKRLGNGQTWGVLLTLTVNPKRYTMRQAWEEIWEAYAVFRKILWKYLKRHGWKHNPYYVAVVEQHKSGFPHLHVCYTHLRFLAPKEVINSAWRMGTTHVKGSRRGERGVRVSALSYVLKYVTKMAGWSEQGLAHLWHAKARLYNISPRLYVAPKDPPAPGWTLEKIDYTSAAIKDLARSLARLRFIQRRRRKGVQLCPVSSAMISSNQQGG